jgi:GWxTD domain-containing protein
MTSLLLVASISILSLQVSTEVDSAAYHLELARRAALEGQVAEATARFYTALQYPLSDSLLDRLYWDLRDLMTPEEEETWQRTPTKNTFLARFWRRRDPTPATPENERLAEHFQRLAEARQRYSSTVDPRGYDDRGMILVRYGPPDDVYLDPGGDVTLPNESWVYHRLGEVTFDFVEFGGRYRLEPDLRRAIVEEATTSRRLWQLTKLFDDRSHLSITYQRAKAELEALAQNPELQQLPTALRHRFNQVLDSYADQIEQQRRQLPQSASSFKVDATPLFYTVAAATFRGENGKTRLEIYYGLPLSELKGEWEANDEDGPVLESYINVMTPSYDVLFTDKQVGRLDPEAVRQGLSYVGQFTTFLAPDTYRVALELISPTTRQRGHFVLTLPLPDYDAREFSISDIELASLVRPAKGMEARPGFVKHGLWVEPYPYRAIPQKQNLMIYYEIYGLTKGDDGATRYRVELQVRSRERKKGFSGFLKAINPFGGKGAAISTSFDLFGDKPDSYEHLALDLSTLEPDSYELQLRVTDLVTGRKARSTLRFRVVEMAE